MAGKNRTRQGKLGCMLGKRRAESESSHGPTRDRHWELYLVKPQSHGNTQINRDGLVEDMN